MSSSQNHQHQPLHHQQSPVPSRRARKALFGAVGLGMVLALTGCNDSADADAGKKDGAPAAQPKAPSAEAPASPGAGNSAAPGATPGNDQPTVPGWQTQARSEHHFRYDVPGKADKWNVIDQGSAISYTDKNGKPIVVMTGASHYREGGCASNPNPKAFGEAGKGQLATVGTTGGGKEGTLQENARNWAGNWGFVAYGGPDNKPKIEVSQATPWKHGGIDGYTATAKVTVVNRPSPCVPPTAIVHSIAQKLPDGTMHGWVIYADQGVPNALTEAEIQKIMNTVRPTGS
nr:Orf+1 [Streptomyces sp.]